MEVLERPEIVANVKPKRFRNGYVVSLKTINGKEVKGGPVLGGTDLGQLKKDFEKAMSVSMGLTNLFNYKEDKGTWYHLTDSIVSYEYI